MMGWILKSLEGPWYVTIFSLVLKFMKLQIDLNCSVEMTESKRGVAKIDFF
jgi:hypothetical protein